MKRCVTDYAFSCDSKTNEERKLEGGTNEQGAVAGGALGMLR